MYVDFDLYAAEIAETGLITHEVDDELFIARPASVAGTPFRGWEEDYVLGIGNAVLKINAPIAKIRKKSKKRWLLEIATAAAPGPGPGPVWISEEFSNIEFAVEALIECYFGNRIDSNNESLEGWYGSQE